MGAEQSNSSARIGEQAVLKLIRKPYPNINLEEEMEHFLSERSPFRRTPKLLGGLQWQEVVPPITVVLLYEQIRNQGDGWTVTLDYLKTTVPPAMEDPEGNPESHFAYYLPLAERLGQRTAELHAALSQATGDEAFDPEPITAQDMADWRATADELIERAQRAVSLPPVAQALDRCLPSSPKAKKIRVHGDYHLGQLLVAENDFVILDFEGEPAESLLERRKKQVPMKDIAGMLRSFDYAASTVRRLLGDHSAAMLKAWRRMAGEAFLRGYEKVRPLTEEDRQWLRFYLIKKAVYEITYEAQHRPDWIDIPLAGLQELLKEDDHARH